MESHCIECNGVMERREDLEFDGKELDGLHCTKCGYEEFDLEQVSAIIKSKRN